MNENELPVWAKRMLEAMKTLEEQAPPHIPEATGTVEEQATAVLTLLNVLGCDASAAFPFTEKAGRFAARAGAAARNAVSTVEGAITRLDQHLARLAQQNAGPLFSVGKLPTAILEREDGTKLLAVEVAALPEGHRLRDLVPRADLVEGQYLACGPAVYSPSLGCWCPRPWYIVSEAASLTKGMADASRARAAANVARWQMEQGEREQRRRQEPANVVADLERRLTVLEAANARLTRGDQS